MENAWTAEEYELAKEMVDQIHIQVYGQINSANFGADLEAYLPEARKKLARGIKVIQVPGYMSEEELKEKGISPEATVEAEFGNKVIKGKSVTLAHHAEEYKDNPAPCNTKDIPILKDGATIVVSHLDLDTLGGIAALIGKKREDEAFWSAAEFIDLNGAHRMHQIDKETSKKLIAYRAYQETHKLPRIDKPKDITDIVLEHLAVVELAMTANEQLLAKGEEWYQKSQEQMEKCLIAENGNVRVFISQDGTSCSTAYYSEKQGNVKPCTVTLNKRLGTITVGMEDGGKQVSAKKLVEEVWGSKAGGRPGVAGGPREEKMTEEDLQKIANLANERLNEARGTDETLDNILDIISKENDKHHTIQEIEKTVSDRTRKGINDTVAEIAGEIEKTPTVDTVTQQPNK